jgi:hypothetical protein
MLVLIILLMITVTGSSVLATPLLGTLVIDTSPCLVFWFSYFKWPKSINIEFLCVIASDDSIAIKSLHCILDSNCYWIIRICTDVCSIMKQLYVERGPLLFSLEVHIWYHKKHPIIFHLQQEQYFCCVLEEQKIFQGLTVTYTSTKTLTFLKLFYSVCVSSFYFSCWIQQLTWLAYA